MPFLVSSKTKPQYDVIIVGSGAGGGTSAYVLALAGVKVLMLEAGRKYDPVEETPMFQTNAQAPLRGVATSDKPFGFHDATVGGGWTVPGEPYMTRFQGQPKDKFFEASEWQIWGSPQEWFWWRPRMLGGRTNHWGRISLRMGPYDFKPRQRDGLGLDWPIDYKDLEPYYDKVESLIGVWGTNEGLENTPGSMNGTLLPPPRPRVPELFLQKHARALGIPIISSHMALLSRKLDAARIAKSLHPDNPRAQKWTADSVDARLACFWATDCGRGCAIKANYQSTTVHLPPALASGNLDIVTDAMVREVSVDDEGRATGVYYVDKKTKKDVHAKGRIVLLAASGCESARILLNSKSPRFSNGLANSSGKVGRYLMDTVGAGLSGQIPALENMPAFNDEGANMHIYAPWWLYKEQLAGKLGFPRGYHIEIGGGRAMPAAGEFDFLDGLTGGSYGKRFKEEARRYYGSVIGMAGRGEMIPNDDSYCEVDPDKKDAWGIPVLRFRFKWTDYEIKQSQHMRQTFKAVIESMGGKVFGWNGPHEKAIAPGGSIIHEVGTTAMGDDPRASVLNAHCQAWDIKNLFVTDGGPFVSNADKNPTLSIMALAWRTCDFVFGPDAERKYMNDTPLPRISRREAIRWVVAASGSAALLGPRAFAESPAKPYGRDALLNETYKPGDFWPLTFTANQRRTVTALCDLIIPADGHSPAASAVAVPDFIDEWISAPYKEQEAHQKIIVDGLKWLDQEAARRFGRNFAELSLNEQSQIADDICHAPKVKPEYSQAAEFFAVMRSLTATGFYTTPVGWRDIGFVGNVALTAFPDPPPEVLERLGLKKNW